MELGNSCGVVATPKEQIEATAEKKMLKSSLYWQPLEMDSVINCLWWLRTKQLSNNPATHQVPIKDGLLTCTTPVVTFLKDLEYDW